MFRNLTTQSSKGLHTRKHFLLLLSLVSLFLVSISGVFSYFHGNLLLAKIILLASFSLLVITLLIYFDKINLALLSGGFFFYGLTAIMPLYIGPLMGSYMASIAIFVVVSYGLRKRIFHVINASFAGIGFLLCVYVTHMESVQSLSPPYHLDLLSLMISLTFIIFTWQISRRENAQQWDELVKARTFLRQLADLNPQIIITKDKERRFTFLNKAALDLYGMKEETIIGKKDEEILPDFVAENPKYKDDDLRVLEEGAELLHIGPEFHPNTIKGKRWLKPVKKPIRNEKGEIIGLITLAADITEKKKVEEALIESESRYRSIVENNQFGMATDKKGILTSVNEALCRMTGYAREELTGTNVYDIIQIEDPEEVRQKSLDLINGKISFLEISCYFRRKDGSIGHGLVRKNLIKNAKGIPVEQIATIADISHLKATEQKLRTSRERYQILFQAMPLGLILLDTREDLCPRDVNRRWVEMTGVEPERSKKLSLLNFCPPIQEKGRLSEEMIADLLKEYHKSFETRSFEWKFLDQKGNSFHAACILQPVQSVDRALSLMIVRDITEEKKRDALIREQVEDLNDKNQQLSQFGYIVSHNFRSSVANILGLQEILSHQASHDIELGPYISMLGDTVTKLDEAIKDLNWIFSLRKNSQEEFLPVELNKIIQDLLDEFSQDLSYQEAQVEVDMPPSCQAVGHRSYFQSIFQNLLSNSLKYRSKERNPHIHIRITCSHGQLYIQFEDNGLGIDLSRHGQEIFNLYRRLHDGVEGKGIGLYLVKIQTEIMKGSVWVESRLGKGSIFHLSFPLPESPFSPLPTEYKKIDKGPLV